MPGLISGNYMLRAAAEREATNAPLQGSAADLMKLAMVRIDRALDESGLDAAMLLQIHDELDLRSAQERFGGRPRTWCAVTWRVRSTLSVPLEVTLKSGGSWYDVEPMDDLERV